jgi:hypothetical protein
MVNPSSKATSSFSFQAPFADEYSELGQFSNPIAHIVYLRYAQGTSIISIDGVETGA